jgi:prepilin-type N-terminal cleavage/methylation domain-containing protein
MKLPSNRRAGFTLLELLIALALMGFLMIALNSVIFSMGELWGRNSELHLFDQHVNAVTRFLQDQLNQASLPPAARANSSPVAPMAVTPQAGMQDNLISYELPAGSRFFTWPGHPLPEVVCSWQVRPNEGLYFLWHSRLEVNFATTPPRETRITPLATAISYDYYDDGVKQWSNLPAVKTDASGNLAAPNRVRLTFAYGKLTPRTVILTIPKTLAGLPNF